MEMSAGEVEVLFYVFFFFEGHFMCTVVLAEKVTVVVFPVLDCLDELADWLNAGQRCLVS